MTKVLYIAGWGRSGSTLADSLLGQLEGVISAGEIHNTWKRGLRDNRLCGCGQRFQSCPHWTSVFDEAYGGFEELNTTEIVDIVSRVRTRRILIVWLISRLGLQRGSIGRYAQLIKLLYDALGSVGKTAELVVDSSKYPADAVLISSIRSLEVRVLHVVRDPRAVAFSWASQKAKEDGSRDRKNMRRRGATASAIRWSAYNLLVASIVRVTSGRGKYMRLRYEDLVRDPNASLTRIAQFAGLDLGEVRVVDSFGSVDATPSHLASGNPSRFASGTILIRPDERWRGEMTRWDRIRAFFFAWPTTRWMGYRWT